jgi:hypothetical protein
MLKYEFSLRTRDGQKIDGLMIMGRDQAEAEKKLFQMYRQSQILNCELRHGDDKQWQATSVEDILSMISKEH